MKRRNSYSGSALERYNNAKSEEIVQIVREAILYLLDQNVVITLRKLADASSLVSPNGKRISEQTILRNPKTKELFRSSSFAVQKREFDSTSKDKKKAKTQKKTLKQEKTNRVDDTKIQLEYEALVQENEQLRIEISNLKKLIREYDKQNKKQIVELYKLHQEVNK